MFQFRKTVRKHVAALAELMYAANMAEGDWAMQTHAGASDNGVYGYASLALQKIIQLECGPDVLGVIQRSREGFNFGGNATRLMDVEVAIDVAMDRVVENHLAEDAFFEAA